MQKKFEKIQKWLEIGVAFLKFPLPYGPMLTKTKNIKKKKKN